MTRVKICGITNEFDACAAVEAGADAIGLVFASSPRQVTAATARRIARGVPPWVTVVGVFADQDPDAIRRIAADVPLDVIQLHGSEPPGFGATLQRRVVQRVRVQPGDTPADLAGRLAPYAGVAVLLDPGAGDGRIFDWSVAAALARSILVAGGLTPDNVGALVRTLHLAGVDVSSGVEQAVGRKDATKMRAFVAAVRQADADIRA
ncbi:MAG: phosphoribosylanthranilate isomerase [Phycisphaerae bacterium]